VFGLKCAQVLTFYDSLLSAALPVKIGEVVPVLN
jgi:hypothetical protein